MSQAHHENLRYLMKFLKLVADSSDANKMTSKNLAIVIAPSILWPRDSAANSAAKSVAKTVVKSAAAAAANSFDSRVVDLVEFMITNADELFPAGKIMHEINLRKRQFSF